MTPIAGGQVGRETSLIASTIGAALAKSISPTPFDVKLRLAKKNLLAVWPPFKFSSECNSIYIQLGFKL